MMTEKELNDFKKLLDGKTSDELLAMEKEVVAEAEKLDKEVAEKEFTMPTENYEEVATSVRYFLNKQSVQWQYTPAMVGMYDFWNPEKRQEKIPYAQLDTILRTLGGLQFTGYNEWAMVIAVNKFFESLRADYMETTQLVYDVATKHNAIMEKLDIVTPVEGKEA